MTEVLDRPIQWTEPAPLRQRLVNDPDLDLLFERVTQSRPTLKDRLLLDPDLDLLFDNVTKSLTAPKESRPWAIARPLSKGQKAGLLVGAMGVVSGLAAVHRPQELDIQPPPFTISLPASPSLVLRPNLPAIRFPTAEQAQAPITTSPEINLAEELNPENNIYKNIGIRLYEEALEKRAQERAANPEHALAIDEALNENRVNILVLGMGIEKENLTDTIMLVSYDIKSNTVKLISTQRDTDAPEIYRYKKGKGVDEEFNAVNTAYATGGTQLIKEIVENETVMWVDYVFRIDLKGFIELIDETVGEVEVQVSEDFQDDPVFTKKLSHGKQKLTGDQLQQYLRARQTTGEDARNWRQQDVLFILLKSFKARMQEKNPVEAALATMQIGRVVRHLEAQNRLETDIPVVDLLKIYAGEKAKAVIPGQSVDTKDPQQVNLVLDMEHGLDYASEEGLASRPHLLTVRGGDPRAQNLPQDYWKRLRDEVKTFILKPT